VGRWTEPKAWPSTGTHLVLLPTGKLLHFEEERPDTLHLWDPRTDTHAPASHPGYNAFCAGHAFLADGQLLVAGGHVNADVGLPHASLYSPATGAWTRLPDMNAGRWYPTVLPLPDGEALVIAGTDTAAKTGENPLPQVFQPASRTWRDLTGAQRVLLTYPWMYNTPDGRVFMAGPAVDSMFLDVSGTGAWSPGPRTSAGTRLYGSSVMYDEGKVMVVGGGTVAPTPTVEVIDLTAPAPAFRRVQPMSVARKQHNTTLLPDGTVLVTGGSSGSGKSDEAAAVLTTELFDPVTETFTRLAPSARFRGYHSSAVLLPDGRVLSAGGQYTFDAEVFSPPYLFKGPRPRVTAAPASVRYGEGFRVETPDASRIARVTWLSPGAVTHAFNQNQRINHLHFQREEGGVRVTAPASASLAVPGDYMLFLLDEKGVPSEARFVRLGGAPAAPPPPVPAVSATEAPWAYLDGGQAPPAGWREAGFDASAWGAGVGPFSTAPSAAGTRLSLPAGQSTVSLLHRFVVDGAVFGGELEVGFADGVAVSLNGRTVLLRNMPEGAAHDAWATARAAAGTTARVRLPAALLRDGVNVLAVTLKRARAADGEPARELRLSLGLTVRTRGGAGPAPQLRLTAPNGGETLTAGTTATLRWETPVGRAAEVRLELSTDDGATWQPLAERVANTGAWAWQVPALDSARARVRVSTPDGAASDRSDAAFTLAPPSVAQCTSSNACKDPVADERPPGVQPGEPDLPAPPAGGAGGGCSAGGGAAGTVGAAAGLLLALLRRRRQAAGL
jgi:hypothetical protein